MNWNINRKKTLLFKQFSPLYLVIPPSPPFAYLPLSRTHMRTHLAYSALTPEVREVVEACESHHTGRTVSLHLDVYVCLFVGACSPICLRVSDQERFRETSVVVLSLHWRHMGYFYPSTVADPDTVVTFIIKMPLYLRPPPRPMQSFIFGKLVDIRHG